jgi:hypothetical protein
MTLPVKVAKHVLGKLEGDGSYTFLYICLDICACTVAGSTQQQA